MPKPITFTALRDQLRRPDVLGSLAPVYLLHGEEGYYTDELVKLFETVMPEGDREFNQYVLYGPQTSADVILDCCRRFPMMSTRQLVIVKELQSVRADIIDKLSRYITEPNASTVLVLCARGEKIKGAKFQAAMRKSDITVCEGKKISERELPGVIANHINARGLNAQPKAIEMLRDYIGADLSRLYNEVDKLITILGQGATVTPEAVEQHVGISKDYNAFELVDALATRDAAKATRITRYFRANPKAVPTVMLTASIFAFFSDVLVTFFVRDKSERGLMQALGLKSPWPLRRINVARQHYNAYQGIEIIRAIRAFDCATKGIGSRRDQYDLLDELIFRILSAPGTLFPKY